MPRRCVPSLPALMGPLSAALAIVAVLALMPGASPVAHAQRGPDLGFGGPGFGPPPIGGSPGFSPFFGEPAVPGQTQLCREYPGAQANYGAYYGPGYPSSFFGWPWGFPLFSSYNLPPFGGFWGFYSGYGPVCLWQPH